MASLAKSLFRWNESSKNADISILSNFLAIFSDLHMEKLYKVLSTCQISDQWDHANRKLQGGGGRFCLPLAIPICKKPGLFRVKVETSKFTSQTLESFHLGTIVPQVDKCFKFMAFPRGSYRVHRFYPQNRLGF